MITGVSNNPLVLQTQLKKNLTRQDEALERLATGRRINSGRDDPAGLIVAQRLQADLATLEGENRALERFNANATITDGHLAQLTSLTADASTHLLAAANTGGMSDAELAAHQLELDSVVGRLQRSAYDAAESLSGIKLPDPGNDKLAEDLTNAAAAMHSLFTGGENDLRSGRLTEAQAVIDQAGTTFASARGTVGAYQRNTVETRLRSLAVERENILAAHSRVVDADYAEESMNLARAKVAVEANIHVLRIADHNARMVLDLLS